MSTLLAGCEVWIDNKVVRERESNGIAQQASTIIGRGRASNSRCPAVPHSAADFAEGNQDRYATRICMWTARG